MLEGTDLYSAFVPMGADSQQGQYEQPEQEMVAAKKGGAGSNTYNGSVAIAENAVASKPSTRGLVENPSPSPVYDAGSYNGQYDQESKLMAIVQELKKRQAAQAARDAQPSYFDKLLMKRKDLMKFLQSALIIVFALAVHFLINHYFSWYLSNYDVSFERELILRVLYPVAILFVAWNIMLILKN